MLLLVVILSQGVTGEYANASTICDRCRCETANQTHGVWGYSMINCAGKGVQHMLDSWPAPFDASDSETEIALSLSSNNLTHLQQLPATSATLIFACRHCNLESVASGLFLDTPNVMRVDLSYNRLTGDALSADAFRGQYDTEHQLEPLLLDELDLGANAISNLQEDVFTHIATLRELSLAGNPLGTLDGSTGRALAQLVHLEKLDLSFTSLVDIDDALLAELHALRELHIGGNQFTTIPDAVYRVPSLHILSLCGNPIEVLSIDKLRNNTAMEEFDLAVFRFIPQLEELDLSRSGLKGFRLPAATDDDSLHKNPFPHALEMLLLGENPWHCDCALQQIVHHAEMETLIYDDQHETRCETPYTVTALHLAELKYVDMCDLPMYDGGHGPAYEKPAFLRPGAILLSLLSVTIVVGLGIVIGLVIVCLKRRLKTQGLGFTSPVRYTSVRDSTASGFYQA
uniref:LRRCT domain-containing protein n=1 Tax=Anopheles epiroticus TaxID=199890 RepID=A0A182PG94_9DIPT